MVNKECLKDFIDYIDENIQYKDNGKACHIKVKNMCDNFLERGYSNQEFYSTFNYAVKYNMIELEHRPGIKASKPGQLDVPSSAHISPSAQKIVSLTKEGFEFFALINQRGVWDKIKDSKTFDMVISAISAGKTLIDICQVLLK